MIGQLPLGNNAGDNEAAATAAQSKLNSTRRLAESYQERMTRLQAEYQKLLEAKVKLEARLTTMKQQREEFQALIELARSKETTVKAIKGLDNLMGSGDADVDRVAQGIYAWLDKVTTAAEMQATSLEERIDDVLYRSASRRTQLRTLARNSNTTLLIPSGFSIQP